jgi:hypothetical protein
MSQFLQQEQQLNQLTSGYYFESNDASKKSMQQKQIKQQEPSHSEQVLDGLSYLKENKILCDVTLIAEGML